MIAKIRDEFQHLLMPPRAFECRLALIQPSSMRLPSNNWSREANKLLRDKTINNRNCHDVRIEVYSLVYGVARVRLFINNECINDALVEKKLAEEADEDYMSKVCLILMKL